MKQKILVIITISLVFLGQTSALKEKNIKSPPGNKSQLHQNEGNKLEIITFLYGKGENGRLGYSVAGIGDVNLDGFDDVLVGNPDQGPGQAWILFGGAQMDSLPDVILRGEAANDLFGSNVAAGGDINGDKAPDFLVSAGSYGQENGRMYLFFGGAQLDTVPDMTFTGVKGSGFGYRIVTGDVNGDSSDDILTSTPGYYPGLGKVYLYYGGSQLDTIPDWTNTGDSIYTCLGSSIAIGDINSDLKKDILIVSSPGFHPTRTVTEIFLNKTHFDTIPDYRIIYPLYGDGRERMVMCSDFNQDGIDDFLTKYYGYKIYYGSQEPDMEADAELLAWGLTYILHFADAGDVNGDGYPDVIAGAPKFIFDTGSVQLFLGSKNINGTADWTAGGRGITGQAVDGAGDVNGDGYDDIIVSDLVFPTYWFQESYVYILAGDPDLKDAGVTRVSDHSQPYRALSFQLHQNYPNPFNPQTSIRYQIPVECQVTLQLFNMRGKRVRTLVNGFQTAQFYEIHWDGKNELGQSVAAGIYICQLQAGEYQKSIRLVLVR